MKTKLFAVVFLGLFFAQSCSKSIQYSEELKQRTAGKYQFNDDDIMIVSYEDNTVFLKWRGVKIKPVALDSNTFFVPDMYKKLRFVQHIESKDTYLSIIPEDDSGTTTYDYIKLPDNYKTPSQHLDDGSYDLALQGYLKIREKDSTSSFISERKFNNMGYRFLREKKYDDAIGVFKMNVELHPNSGNVYDSLAEGYLRSGDSLQAFSNYTKALEINKNNKGAQQYIDAYKKK